jgi:hypothetical protein
MDNDLPIGDQIRVPFHTWHRQWAKEHRGWRIWATNLPEPDVDDVPDADLRGEMAELQWPIEAGDRLQIVIVPDGDSVEVPIELPLIRESLTAPDARGLGTAIRQIIRAQGIDAADALCFIAQLHLGYLDWGRVRRGEKKLIEEQPRLPSDPQTWNEQQFEQFFGYSAFPHTTVAHILQVWTAFMGTLLGGFPGAIIDDDERPTYVTIPARLLPPPDVEAIYGIAVAESANEMRKYGTGWLLTFRGESKRLKKLRGIGFIAFLVENQGRSINVVELDSVGQKKAQMGQNKNKKVSEDLVQAHGLDLRSRVRSDDLMDQAAVKDLDARLVAIDNTELPLAELRFDADEIDRLKSEATVIRGELLKAQGKGGKPKPIEEDDWEKTRKRVFTAIVNAYEEIQKEHPSLHQHLKDSIETGEDCIYSPLTPESWNVTFA